MGPADGAGAVVGVRARDAAGGADDGWPPPPRPAGRGSARAAGPSGAAAASGARRAVGAHGEAVAARHLVDAGMVVLDRGWRCRAGELDIVARDGDVLVAVEVRTRRSTRAGTPLESITPAKVARLRRLLGLWLEAHPVRPAGLRLDAVAVLRPPRGAARVVHVRGIG